MTSPKPFGVPYRSATDKPQTVDANTPHAGVHPVFSRLFAALGFPPEPRGSARLADAIEKSPVPSTSVLAEAEALAAEVWPKHRTRLAELNAIECEIVSEDREAAAPESDGGEPERFDELTGPMPDESGCSGGFGFTQAEPTGKYVAEVGGGPWVVRNTRPGPQERWHEAVGLTEDEARVMARTLNERQKGGAA